MTPVAPPAARLADVEPALRAALVSPRPVRRPERPPVPPAWDVLAPELDAHTAGPLVLARACELGLASTVPADVRARWAAQQLHARLQRAVQGGLVRRVSAELGRQGVRHAWMKGVAVQARYYRPAWARVAGDCDLLVTRRDAGRARVVLRRLGFEHATCTVGCRDYRVAAGHEVAGAEARHHELAQLVHDVRLHGWDGALLAAPFVSRPPFAFEVTRAGAVLHAHVDVHWALHPHLAAADPLATAELSSAGAVPLLGREWSLLFTGFKVYFEAGTDDGTRLVHLVDLAAQARDRPDWSLVDALARRFGVHHALLHALDAAGRLVGDSLAPPGLTDAWARAPRDPVVLDRGGVGGVLLGDHGTARWGGAW